MLYICVDKAIISGLARPKSLHFSSCFVDILLYFDPGCSKHSKQLGGSQQHNHGTVTSEILFAMNTKFLPKNDYRNDLWAWCSALEKRNSTGIQISELKKKHFLGSMPPDPTTCCMFILQSWWATTWCPLTSQAQEYTAVELMDLYSVSCNYTQLQIYLMYIHSYIDNIMVFHFIAREPPSSIFTNLTRQTSVPCHLWQKQGGALYAPNH